MLFLYKDSAQEKYLNLAFQMDTLDTLHFARRWKHHREDRFFFLMYSYVHTLFGPFLPPFPPEKTDFECSHVMDCRKLGSGMGAQEVGSAPGL
jgi:hypothetical protein